jgi:group I intron endonuclease
MEDRDYPQRTTAEKQWGYIYIITCQVNNKMYVGQTSRTVQERWAEHLTGARKWARDRGQPGAATSAPCAALYNAMADHGVEQFGAEELCRAAIEELNELEKYYVVRHNTLAPNGYNITPGGGGGGNGTAISTTRRAKVDQLRSPKLAGMPNFFTYRNYPNTGEQILLLKHPLCKSKCFSVKEHGTFEAAKAAALAFHAKLEAEGVPYQRLVVASRRTQQMPEGMYRTTNGQGYGYSKYLGKKGYRKQYASAKKTPEENKRLCIDHYNALMRSHGLPPIDVFEDDEAAAEADADVADANAADEADADVFEDANAAAEADVEAAAEAIDKAAIPGTEPAPEELNSYLSELLDEFQEAPHCSGESNDPTVVGDTARLK